MKVMKVKHMKNFKLTDESVVVNGRTLYRIECIKDFQYAKVGDKGGFVEKECNLNGDAWIGDDACVYDNARVFGNARVFDIARVYGKAMVFGKAWVTGSAKVYGYAEIFGHAQVSAKSRVFDNAHVCGSARVHGSALVFGNARIFQDACVYGNAQVYGSTKIFGNAEVLGFAEVNGGDWSETPFQVQGSRHFVSMYSPTELKIGCQRYTLSFWKENFEKIGNEFKYTTEQIKEYKEYIDLAIEKYEIK